MKPKLPTITITGQDVVLFVGKRGTGKSTRAKEAARQCMVRKQRVLAFDPFDEWSQLGRPSKHVVLGPLTQRIEFLELLAEPEMLLSPDLAAALVPNTRDPEARGLMFSRLVDRIAEVAEDEPDFELVLFADEVGNWAAHASKALQVLAYESRHWGVGFAPVSQRMVHFGMARSQATQINSGRQDLPADVAALADVAGKEFADEVATLGPWEWRHWTDAISAPEKRKEKKT